MVEQDIKGLKEDRPQSSPSQRDLECKLVTLLYVVMGSFDRMVLVQFEDITLILLDHLWYQVERPVDDVIA